jgi:ATP-binding cassette subfamily B protein
VLSEGQKQRIAIARALIKNPKILILDEAMSSLDSESEEKIINNIIHSYGDITLIIVSHRFSAIRKVDSVYFIKSPGQITINQPQQLLQNDAEFYNLFAAQLK